MRTSSECKIDSHLPTDDGSQCDCGYFSHHKPNQSELEQKLEEVLTNSLKRAYLNGSTDVKAREGGVIPNDTKLGEVMIQVHVAETKQSIKQLVADEMRELIIGEDLRPLPNGYMPESHEEVNNRLAIQRAKLAEWIKEEK